MRLEEDKTIKEYTLKSCGAKWRAFKTTLRSEYMLKNICPRETYTFLDPKIWKEFCRIEHYTDQKLVHFTYSCTFIIYHYLIESFIICS